MNVVFVVPVRTLFFLTLFSSSAFAEPLHALIFAGGAKPEAAQAALAAFKAKLANQVDNVVKLPAGEPRVVESAKLPGLKPGFHIVTLGTCKDPGPVLAALKALYPGTYSKPLTGDVGPERCPTLVEGTEAAPLDPPSKVGAFVVNAFALTEKATGLVKDLVTVEGDTADRVGDGPGGWEYETCSASVTPNKSGFTVTRVCTSERTGCGLGEHAIPRAWSDESKVTVASDTLSASLTKKSITSKAACR